MLFITHLFFSLLVGLLTYNYFNLNPVVFVLVVLFTGILPDIDHPKSKIGRRLKILSYPINFIFGHRGIVHSIFFAIILGLLIKIFFGNYYIPFSIGFLSHLLADGLTKQGVDFTFPLNIFRVNGIVRTGSFVEKLVLIILFLIDVYLLTKLLV